MLNVVAFIESSRQALTLAVLVLFLECNTLRFKENLMLLIFRSGADIKND